MNVNFNLWKWGNNKTSQILLLQKKLYILHLQNQMSEFCFKKPYSEVSIHSKGKFIAICAETKKKQFPSLRYFLCSNRNNRNNQWECSTPTDNNPAIFTAMNFFGYNQILPKGVEKNAAKYSRKISWKFIALGCGFICKICSFCILSSQVKRNSYNHMFCYFGINVKKYSNQFKQSAVKQMCKIHPLFCFSVLASILWMHLWIVEKPKHEQGV